MTLCQQFISDITIDNAVRRMTYDKDVVKYVKRAMCAVGEDYTKRTIEAGEAAKQHLKEAFAISLSSIKDLL